MAFLRLINALALLQIRWKLRATYTPAAIMKRKDGIALPSHLCWCSLELHHSVLSLAPESQKPPTPQRQSICSSLRGEATPSIAFDINAVPTMTTLQLAAGAGRRRRSLVALLLLCLAVAVAPRAADASRNYTVGDDKGWYDALAVPGIDYQGWADGKNFSLGDFLGEC
jgi:hypothetical protein